MRYLLIIPAFFLFLSNIPFIQEMDMESMPAMTVGEDCCSKNGNMESVCQKPPVEEIAKDEHCPKATTETTCICICCFQYAAPEQFLIKFNTEVSIFTTYNSIMDQHWIDPFLSGPWQPPDFI